MDIIKWFSTDNLVLVLVFFLFPIGVQAFHSITKNANFEYHKESHENSLDEKEEIRLDNLLTTGRKFHNWSFIFAGLLLALSALENVSEISSPIGEISIPIIPTAIGLYLLVIITIVITDRFLTLAFPWISLDKRRLPFDWLIFGLDYRKRINFGIWETFPIFLAAVGLSIILKSQSSEGYVLTSSAILMLGFILSQAPRVISHYYYLITKKIDHRGGQVTFSIYLLYNYRLFRMFLFTLIIVFPIIAIIPQWKSKVLDNTLLILLVVYALLWIIRLICGNKKVYRWIDKKGKKFGFPINSKHYE